MAHLCPARLTLAVALACAVAFPARAEIAADARPVVDRYLEATGGRAALDSIRSLRIRSSITAFGLKGTSTTWTRQPDRRATETLIGPFRILEGFDGRVAWRTDPNGQLVFLDGKDLEDAKASAYFQNDRWLRADQGGGKIARTGTETDSAGTFTVLEVTPPIGRPRRFYFNEKSGLVDRVTLKRDQQLIESSPSDYRRAAGRLMPFRERTRIVGMPANDLLVTTDSVFVNAAIDDSRFAAPVADSAAISWLKTPGRARIPFRYDGRHVWLTVRVNGGEPADFLYDTGASITVIDSAYAARIGLETQGKLQGQGAGAGGEATFSQLASAQVRGEDGDGVELRGQKVAVLAINGFLAPYFWRDCAGVIGYDFITRFVNEIDYDHETLVLHDPKGWVYEGQGGVIPFSLAGAVPVVHMKLDGRYEGEFRIDVGSSSTVDFHTPFVRQHDLTSRAGRVIEATGGGFGGTFRTRIARMQKVELGPYSWERPIVALSAAEAGALASEDYAGNIGNQILERFKITLDYERRRLYLEPGARFGEPDRFSRSGLLLARFGDRVEAVQVLEGSPAQRAGVRAGDVVRTLEGRAAATWTPDEITELFERGEIGRKVVVEIERGGGKKKLRIRLADIL